MLENNRTLPYGELWSPQIASQTTKKNQTYERDSESGLDYAINRFMSNSYGRFVSVDKGPVTVYRPSTLNRYAYVSANPVNDSDPSGNQDEDDDDIPRPFRPSAFGAPGETENPCIEFGGEGSGNRHQAFSPCEGLEPGGGETYTHVKKTYGSTMDCSRSATDMISSIQSNFSNFANTSFSILGGTGTASLTFRQEGTNSPAAITLGAGVSIEHNVTVGGVTVLNQTTHVVVTAVTGTSFTFTVQNNTPLVYPATIAFSATDIIGGGMNFQINVDAYAADRLSDLAFTAGVAHTIEDGVWKHFNETVSEKCKPGGQ